MVDVAPFDDSDPVDNARKIVSELEKFSPALARKERWLVLNKVDMIAEELVDALSERFKDEPGWESMPIYRIAAISGEGCPELCQQVMVSVEEHKKLLLEDPDYQDKQKQLDEEMEFEIRKSIERSRASRASAEEVDDFDDFEDD